MHWIVLEGSSNDFVTVDKFLLVVSCPDPPNQTRGERNVHGLGAASLGTHVYVGLVRGVRVVVEVAAMFCAPSGCCWVRTRPKKNHKEGNARADDGGLHHHSHLDDGDSNTHPHYHLVDPSLSPD